MNPEINIINLKHFTFTLYFYFKTNIFSLIVYHHPFNSIISFQFFLNALLVVFFILFFCLKYDLKSDPHLPKKTVLFASMKAL